MGLASGFVDDHPVIHPVHHIDIAIAVHADAAGMVQGIPAVDFVGKTAEQSPAGSELLHPIVAPVGDEQVAVAVDGKAVGHIQLILAVALAAETAQVVAVFAELLDAAVKGIDHPQVVVGVKGPGRPGRSVPRGRRPYAPNRR